MRFSPYTLSSTSRMFQVALATRGLSLSMNSAMNLWAQIILGKNYSSASAHAASAGSLPAIPITAETIQAALRARNREVDYSNAEQIFLEALREDLPAVSSAIHELSQLIGIHGRRCFISILSDRTGLGIMDTQHAGYIPVSRLSNLHLAGDEVAWLRSSSQMAAFIINALGGLSDEESMEIFAKNHRRGEEKKDEVFRSYFSPRTDLCCQAIAIEMLTIFDPILVKDWDLDFDTIHDAVFSVFEHETQAAKDEWLSPDSNLAETVIDHVAVQLRSAMKWMCEQANFGEEDGDPTVDTLAHTARLSMDQVLTGRRR